MDRVEPGVARMAKRPTRREMEAARNREVPDVIGPGLRVLFCGINPSLYSAVVGHHFARPGNRFWPTLHGSGFTPRLLVPAEDGRLIEFGCGVTNLVARATARADELSPGELASGGEALAGKVHRWGPGVVAFLGVTAYRTAFGEKRASIGLQGRRIGSADVWVLPNPSGLNAHYQLPDFVRLYAAMRAAAWSND